MTISIGIRICSFLVGMLVDIQLYLCFIIIRVYQLSLLGKINS